MSNESPKPKEPAKASDAKGPIDLITGGASAKPAEEKKPASNPVPAPAAAKPPSEVSWESVEKKIKTSAASPEDIEEWAVVVDNSPLMIEVVGRILKSLNMGVHLFRDPDSALKHLRSAMDIKKTVVMFSGLEFKDTSGQVFFKNVQDEPEFARIPFIFLADYPDQKRIRPLGSAVFGTVIKPLKEQDLIDQMIKVTMYWQKLRKPS